MDRELRVYRSKKTTDGTNEQMLVSIKNKLQTGCDQVEFVCLDVAPFIGDIHNKSDMMIPSLMKQAIISKEFLKPYLDQAIQNKKEAAVLVLVHFGPRGTIIFEAGYVNITELDAFFAVSSLPREYMGRCDDIACVDDTRKGSIIPVPNVVPHRMFLVPVNESGNRKWECQKLMHLLFVFVGMIIPSNEFIPHGNDWWDWAREDVGQFDDVDERAMFHLFLLSICLSENKKSIFKHDYGKLIERCAKADRTFMSRFRDKHADTFRRCVDVSTLVSAIRGEIDAICEFYKRMFYSENAAYKNTLPEHIRYIVDAIIHMYS